MFTKIIRKKHDTIHLAKNKSKTFSKKKKNNQGWKGTIGSHFQVNSLPCCQMVWTANIPPFRANSHR